MTSEEMNKRLQHAALMGIVMVVFLWLWAAITLPGGES